MTAHTEIGTRKRAPVEPAIRDYPATISRGRWIIVAATAVMFLAAATYTKLSRPSYRATASVIIDSRLSISTLLLNALTTTPGGSTIQNELEVLKSRSLAESVAVRLVSKMYIDPEVTELINIIRPGDKDKGRRTVASVDEIVRRLEAAISFSPVRESDVIKITAQSVDPREAALLANTFARMYYNRNVQKSRERSRSVREFLDGQVTEKRASLDELETRLQKYMETKGIVSLDDEARKLIDQLAQLEATRDATEISLQSLTKALASYENQIPLQEQNLARAIGGASDPYIRILQEQLATLEVQRDVAISQNPLAMKKEIYSDKLKEIDSQIRTLREKLQIRTNEFVESLVPSSSGPDQTSATGFLRQVKQKLLETQIEVHSLQAKKKALDDVVRQYEKEFERIPGKSIQFARLQRARLSTEKLYLALNEKYNEATIAEESQFGYIDIIDEAPPPLYPASPNVLLNLVAGAVLGLLLGVAYVLFREYRDPRIHSPEDLKVKGMVPSAVVMEMGSELRRLGLEEPLSVNRRQIDPRLFVHVSPLSPVSEAYRKLRTDLQYERIDRKPETILVTSAGVGEGKSITTANLAVAFSQVGKTVLAIDANLRSPTLHSIFGLKPRPGLTELLLDKVGSENVVQFTVARNLHLLPAGRTPTTPAELIESERMRELIEQARMEYDVVLFDTPPLMTVTDAGVLSTMVDSVVLVISAGVSRIEDVTRSVEMIKRLGRTTPQFVLNNFDPKRAYGMSFRHSGFRHSGESPAWRFRGGG